MPFFCRTLSIKKLKNQNYPFTELCGAGVAYKLACALSGRKLEVFLPFVAIATVSDIVSLTDENRVIVSLGLSYWDQYLPYGIKKMCESLELTEITGQEISFKLAPRINAPGRLGTPIDAVNLYLEKNKISYITGITWTTDAMFRETKALVEQRKIEGAKIVEMEQSGCIAMAQYRGFDYGAIIYGGDDVSQEEWNTRSWDKRKGIRYNLVMLCRELAKEF